MADSDSDEPPIRYGSDSSEDFKPKKKPVSKYQQKH